jgi:DNA repair exonuclease SbcCD ATPase subunit
MDSSELLEVVETEKPSISNEDYQELINIRQAIIEGKAQKSDLQDWLAVAENYASKFEEAKKQYEQIVAAINDNAKLMEKRVKEIVIDPFKIEGEFTISETEPHYITKPVPQVAPEQA